MKTWIQFLVLTPLFLVALAGMRCQPDPVSPGTGGTGGEAAATPAVGGSGGFENPFTGGSPGTGGAVTRCGFTEVRAVARADRRALQPRVINGTPAEPGTLGFLVSLQSASGSHYCTGELVAPDWVLTAGHCLPPYAGDKVVAGKHDLRAPGGQTRSISRALRHEGYVDWSEGHDLALLELSAPVEGIEPVQLSSTARPPVPGVRALLAGWGRTCSTCPTSPQLLVSSMADGKGLTLLDQLSCRLAYPGSITNSMVCASGPGEDAAPGDSGGFLGQSLGGSLTQVAVVSWGRPCRAADQGQDPKQLCVGVYASVSDDNASIRACINQP
jgi:secreted trypsin-like serine protease